MPEFPELLFDAWKNTEAIVRDAYRTANGPDNIDLDSLPLSVSSEKPKRSKAVETYLNAKDEGYDYCDIDQVLGWLDNVTQCEVSLQSAAKQL